MSTTSYSRFDFSAALPGELLQMLRHRAHLTQAKLAKLLGLTSSRIIPAWEASEVLPKPERLRRLIEIYLELGAFRVDEEYQESLQLWNRVKYHFESTNRRYLSYPIFDKTWFNQQLEKLPPKPQLYILKPENSQETYIRSESELIEKPATAQNPTPTNLPANTGMLIGREVEISQLCQLLTSPSIQLLTLSGTGGIGKTRLAAEVAKRLYEGNHFKDGVWWVDLQPVINPQFVLTLIGRTLGIENNTASPGSEAELAGLKSQLEDRTLLLVLDNFEHLMGATTRLAELVSQLPHLKILVTSREVLRLYEEQEYYLSPLALPQLSRLDSAPLSELSSIGSVALFVERVRQRQANFELSQLNKKAIARICILLEGLPLALELAAGRSKLYSLEQLIERISVHNGRLNFLVGSARYAQPRHQTIRQTLEWSYQQLSELEQQVLRRLAVFRGGFTLRAAKGVVEGVDFEKLASLMEAFIDKSLLYRLTPPAANENLAIGSSDDRYAFLEVLREYLTEQLLENKELEKILFRQALFYQQLLVEADPHIRGGKKQLWWMIQLDLELDNFRAVLNWIFGIEDFSTASASAEDFTRSELGLDLISRFARVCNMKGYFQEAYNWLERAFMIAKQYPVLKSTQAFARSLEWWAILENNEVSPGEKEAALKSALDIYSTLEDKRSIGNVYQKLGVIKARQSDFDAAQDYYRQSIQVRQEFDDKLGMAFLYNNLGVLAVKRNQNKLASQFYHQALELFKVADDNYSLAMTLNNLGAVERNLKNYSRARVIYLESLTIRRQLGDNEGIAVTYNNLAGVLEDLGELEEAETCLNQSLLLSQKTGNKHTQAFTIDGLASLALVRQDYVQARSLYSQSLSLFENFKDKPLVGNQLVQLGLIALKEHNFAEAQTFFNQSLAIGCELQIPLLVIKSLSGLAGVCVNRDQIEECVSLAGTADRLCQKHNLENEKEFQEILLGSLQQAKLKLEANTYSEALQKEIALPMLRLE